MSNTDVLGRFVWHELLTTDTAGAAAFYPKVVPWRTAPSSMPGYTIWMAGQVQIGGLMALPVEAGASPPHWLMYVGTPNVDATCTQAQGLGARVVKSAADIPNVGRFAVLSDPQGATFAVFTAGPGQPAQAPQAAQGGFSWHELATTDVAGALRFYGELFGWRKGPSHDMGPAGVYQLIEHAGNQVGGMCRPGATHTAPSWLSYVHVADCARAVAAAKAAGGRLLHGPMEVPGGSWIGLLTDPQGGAFAVHELPRAADAKPAPAKPAAAVKPAAAPKAAAPAKPAASAKPAAPPAKAPAAPAAPAKPAAAAKPAAKPKPAAKASKAKKPKKAGKSKKAARKGRKAAGRKAARRPARRKGARKPARRAARRPARRATRGKRAGARRRRR
jgi:predicted enzyme related to lactoylglutathione lyase